MKRIMSMKRIFAPAYLSAVLMMGSTGSAAGHGAVSMDDDRCILTVGGAILHFAGYQLERSRSEFCEDIPSTGKTAIVLDMIDRSLRDVPLGFRLERLSSDGTAKVLMEEPMVVHPSGTITIKYDFTEPGNYVGVVTAPESFAAAAVFPFAVGSSQFPWMTVGIAALAAIGGGGLVLRKSLARLPRTSAREV
jgi:hypothetical protein